MDDDDDEYNIPDGGLQKNSIDSENHDDVDPFEELGIGSRRIPIDGNAKESNDNDLGILSDLIDDGDDDGGGDEIDGHNADAENLYVMLLQTVWVDGILDPAEVRLLAKKREELKISFGRHLELVQNLIG